MATKFAEFEDKIDYTSAHEKDISEIFASNTGSGILMSSVKFYHDRSLLPWQRN